ncbi:metal ABC transporter ATP-binding protein [Leucobacter sp. HY1908]
MSFALPSGSLSALMGPNGAGKSTLVQSLLGLTASIHGSVTFFGQPLRKVRPRVAYVPQRSNIDLTFPITAFDTVLLGTYPRRKFGQRVRAVDRKVAAESLSQLGMGDYSGSRIGDLSGGQLQRVFLARALAQRAELFILDEPLTGVDHASELIITQQLRELSASGRTILAVHHNPATVQSYFDNILLFNRTLAAHGPARQVIQSQQWRELYATVR